MATTAKPELDAAVPALGPESAVIWPPRSRHQIANGLEIVLVESHTIPKFSGILYFRSGNAVTALQAPGIAEITSAVLRTGTKNRTSRQIEEDLRRMGADLGTSAGSDTGASSTNQTPSGNAVSNSTPAGSGVRRAGGAIGVAWLEPRTANVLSGPAAS